MCCKESGLINHLLVENIQRHSCIRVREGGLEWAILIVRFVVFVSVRHVLLRCLVFY